MAVGDHQVGGRDLAREDVIPFIPVQIKRRVGLAMNSGARDQGNGKFFDGPVDGRIGNGFAGEFAHYKELSVVSCQQAVVLPVSLELTTDN